MGPLCSSGPRATAQRAHLLRRHCIDVLFLMFIIIIFIKLKMTCSFLIWIYKWHYIFHCLGTPISEFTQWHYVFHCLGIPISEFTQSDLAANSVCYLHTSTEEIYMDSFTFSVTDGKNQVIYYLSSNISKNIKN